MDSPVADRPHMPGYGIAPADEGSGLLPWSWAVSRLTNSHDYWCATVCADGRPHVMPVWAVWLDDGLWFSSSRLSRKARNLAIDPRCSLGTDDARNPVIVEGVTDRVTDWARLGSFLEAMNDKYGSHLEPEFLDPDGNSSFVLAPTAAFGMRADDFTGSPTRWRFG